MDSLPDLRHSTEVVTSMVEIPNLELGEGSSTMIDDVEGLVGQIVLHGDEACVVQRGGGHVVVGDELPPSGLQVCPPSPLSPSPLVAGGVHGCGGDLISTMDSGEIRATGLDRVSIYPAPEMSCEEAFTDGRAVKWDLRNLAHSLLRSDMVSRSQNGVLHCVPVLDDGEQQVVAECTLQRDAPLSRSLGPQIRDCADEQRYGIVGVAVDQPFSVGIGVGEAESMQEVDDTFIDGGCVKEEVRALRPQPTDGLWQPLSSSTEPVSERVKKGKGVHGGDSGLAPPASPRRQPALVRDILTLPRRHRSLVDECRRHFQVAHPRLMWSYDSAKHRDHRVRSVVEKSMREGLGSEEVVFRPDLPDLAPIQIPDCEEALGPSTVSAAPSDGIGLEMEVAELSKLSSVVSDFDGASEQTDGFVDGEEPKDRGVDPDILSYPYVPVSAPSPPRVAGAEDRGYGALVNVVDTIGDVSSPSFSCLGPKTRSCPDFQNAGVAETVGAGECPATLSPMVCSSLSSRSLGPLFLDCADEQRNGLVGYDVA
ncbi:hypothetical protein Dimus_030469 [Dionaea muscipula]